LTFERDDRGEGDPHRPHARVEAYVCRTCGLTELYTRDFETLPIGPLFGTELFEVPLKPPYRAVQSRSATISESERMARLRDQASDDPLPESIASLLTDAGRLARERTREALAQWKRTRALVARPEFLPSGCFIRRGCSSRTRTSELAVRCRGNPRRRHDALLGGLARPSVVRKSSTPSQAERRSGANARRAPAARALIAPIQPVCSSASVALNACTTTSVTSRS
jgi:hypothetical protein